MSNARVRHRRRRRAQARARGYRFPPGLARALSEFSDAFREGLAACPASLFGGAL
jgi:hypothetical protein